MKRKIISNTYLRDVEKYQIKIFLDEEDYYVSVKKLISVREKFIIKENITVMDNGYYIFEVIPKNENYAMRIFLDENKNSQLSRLLVIMTTGYHYLNQAL